MGKRVGALLRVSLEDRSELAEIPLPITSTRFVNGMRVTPLQVEKALSSCNSWAMVRPSTGWGPEVDEVFQLSGDLRVTQGETECFNVRSADLDPKKSWKNIGFWVPESSSPHAEVIINGVHPYATERTHDEFRACVSEVASRFPRLGIAYYASLAAPLIRPLETHGFVLEFSGPSGTGKGTAVSLAASIWGGVYAGRVASEIGGRISWAMPKPFLHEAVKLRRDLPVCIWGTPPRSAAKELTALSEMTVLDYGAIPQTISPVLIVEGASTPLEEMQEDAPRGGIYLWGPVLGNAPEQALETISSVWGIIHSAGGSLGVEYLKSIVKLCSEGADRSWRESLRKNRDMCLGLSKGWAGHAAAFNCATIITAMHIATAAGFGLGEAVNELVLRDLLQWMTLSAGSTEDRGDAGYRVIMRWASDNEKRFWKGDSAAGNRSGWLGTIAPSGITWVPWKTVEELLAMAGFNPVEIVREMARRGNIVTDGTSAGWVKRVRIAGVWVMCMGFRDDDTPF